MFKQKKSLGQNFLINPEILPEILQAAEIKKDDFVIEVGPGLGILTSALLDKGAKVFAIEKDFELIEKLKKSFKSSRSSAKNLKIVHQDALFFDLSSFTHYKVVANLPFNIAAPLIRKFLESSNQPELMVVMIQKEVAEKIVAQPGNSERGILTLAVEFYADTEIITYVPKTSFRPQPKVDAAVIKITPKPHFGGEGRKVQPEIFFKIVKAGFSAKRRQIHNSLAATLKIDKSLVLDILKKSKINPMLRAEDLSFKDWLNLCQAVAKDDILKTNE